MSSNKCYRLVRSYHFGMAGTVKTASPFQLNLELEQTLECVCSTGIAEASSQ
jgi:hypothetical protein